MRQKIRVATLAHVRSGFGEAVAAMCGLYRLVGGAQTRMETAQKFYLAKLPSKPVQSLLVSVAEKTHNAEGHPIRLYSTG
jgi:hypothetical protein